MLSVTVVRRPSVVTVCATACLLMGVLAAFSCAQQTAAPAAGASSPATPDAKSNVAAPATTGETNTTTATKTPAKADVKPGEKKKVADAPIYIGAYSVDHEFQFITEECMEIIRSKRILFGSRSWGLQLGNIMGNKDPKYKLTWEPYNNPQITDQDRVLKADVFAQAKIVHYVFSAVPKRWAFLDDFLRKDPWKFGAKIDGAFQSLYCGPKKEAQQMAEEYFPMLDKLVKDFPNVKFAILTHPVSGEGPDMKGVYKAPESDWNIGGGDYSEAVIRRYYGKLPIFDIRDIVSTHADGTTCTFDYQGKTYRKLCPEYNVKGGDLIHPNTPEARDRMGKGFLLLLAKMYCADKLPPMDTPKPEILQDKKPAAKKP
jgi:hypothetical protein